MTPMARKEEEKRESLIEFLRIYSHAPTEMFMVNMNRGYNDKGEYEGGYITIGWNTMMNFINKLFN